MTHRRLRRLALLFNALAYICWGFAILMTVSNMKTASGTTFFLLSVVLPAVLAVLFGVPASWFARQKSALKERWEEQFKDVNKVIKWTTCSLEYYEKEALRFLWEGTPTNTLLSRSYIKDRLRIRFSSTSSPFQTSEFIFRLLLKERFVEYDEKTEFYSLSEKLILGAKEEYGLDNFSDPTVHAPFFTGRSFLQTA